MHCLRFRGQEFVFVNFVYGSDLFCKLSPALQKYLLEDGLIKSELPHSEQLYSNASGHRHHQTQNDLFGRGHSIGLVSFSLFSQDGHTKLMTM